MPTFTEVIVAGVVLMFFAALIMGNWLRRSAADVRRVSEEDFVIGEDDDRPDHLHQHLL